MHAGLRDVFVVHAVALRAAAADDFASVRALLIVHRAYYAFVQREALEELHEACLREVQETANFVKWMLPWGVPHSVRDLPALRIDNDENVWLRHGVRHRDNGKPAITWDSNPNHGEWYVDGKRHREGDLPAVNKYRQEWYIRGVLHRENGRPALRCGDVEEWYWNGKLHRDGGLPALQNANRREWWEHGRMHRDGDLPALEEQGGRKEYWVKGKKHREGDKPAIKDKYVWEYWVKGKRHRGGGEPAILRYPYYSNQIGKFEWWENGVRHRADGKPAVDHCRVEEGGVLVDDHWSEYCLQEWWVEGERHRADNLPAVIKEGRELEWWYEGKLHRDDGLHARVVEDYSSYYSQTKERKEWWVNGKRHRGNDLPAVEHACGKLEWYWHGVKHRSKGPAEIDGRENKFICNGEVHHCYESGSSSDAESYSSSNYDLATEEEYSTEES